MLHNVCCLLTICLSVCSLSSLRFTALRLCFVCFLGEGKAKWWFSLLPSDWLSRTTLPICQTYRKYRPVKKRPLIRGICQSVFVCVCVPSGLTMGVLSISLVVLCECVFVLMERCIICLTNPQQAIVRHRALCSL